MDPMAPDCFVLAVTALRVASPIRTLPKALHGLHHRAARTDPRLVESDRSARRAEIGRLFQTQPFNDFYPVRIAWVLFVPPVWHCDNAFVMRTLTTHGVTPLVWTEERRLCVCVIRDAHRQFPGS